MAKPSKARESKRQLVLHKLEALAQSTTHVPEAAAFRAKADELKIHTEHVQVAPVIQGRSKGEVVIGYWFLENGNTVVVCDANGKRRRHHDISTRVTLLPNQNARETARRLIRKLHGEDPGGGFYRRLRYPDVPV
jgi:hypothetical protein